MADCVSYISELHFDRNVKHVLLFLLTNAASLPFANQLMMGEKATSHRKGKK